MSDLTALRGIGPATVEMLREAGIRNVETLRNLGAVEAYRRMCFFNAQVSLNALYALEAGLQDRDWRALSDAERQALRERVG